MGAIPEQQSTLKLTHFGRKSGKLFDVTIWFVTIDGELWIGSLDEDRNWVRNLRANSRARVNFGGGVTEMHAEARRGVADLDRFRAAVQKKYPLLSRIIGLFVRNKKQAAFRLVPESDWPHRS